MLIDQPLDKNLKRLDWSGRMLDWGMELSEFDFHCLPQLAIEARALVDFIVECTIPEEDEVNTSQDDRA